MILTYLRHRCAAAVASCRRGAHRLMDVMMGSLGPSGAKSNHFKEVVVRTFIPHHGSVFRLMFVLCAFACVGVNGRDS